MKTTMLFYRRSPESRKHVFNDCPRAGEEYEEFEETWVRLGEMRRNGTIPKKRLRQRKTGRRFKFIDRISPEAIDDSRKERRFSAFCLLLTDPNDFTFLRLREM